MSTFVPFQAIRPIPSKVKAVASKPYDVLNREEALEECKGNPLSFYHVIKPEIDFPADYDHYAPEIYKKGKENLDKLVETGVLVKDAKPQFYVYRLSMFGHTQTGLVGCCAIEDYFNNVIKKHELTRPDKEEDRKNHIRYSRMQYEPVFLSYPHVEAIDQMVEEVQQKKPVYDFIAKDAIHHEVWPIGDDEVVVRIAELFQSEVPKIYVADGHHRTAAGAMVGKELIDARGGHMRDGHRDNYFMAVLFPDNQVKVLDYNRVVTDLNGLDEPEFLAEISRRFFVEPKTAACAPPSMHTFGMYLGGQWYQLTSKKVSSNGSAISKLDVSILSKQILEPILDIVDLRTDKRIDFVGGMRGLGELEKRVNSGEMKVAFSLHPVSMQQIIEVSENDQIMPPKVTWFEPKLRSGLFVHAL